MSQPFISIIVPVYNVEKYLHKCIDSILNQTFSNFELLLIDDGSLDNSGKICDEYANIDKRIKVYHKKNEGVSTARNLGLKIASGEWVSFIDSDDWIEPNYCSELISHTNNSDLVYFTATHHYTNDFKSVAIPKQCICQNREDIEELILLFKKNTLNYDFFGYTWNKIFKKNIIAKYNVHFTENLSIREDEIFTANYCRHIKTLSVVPTTLYNYRVLDTGLTAKHKNSDEIILLAEKLKEEIPYIQSHNLAQYEKKRIIAFYYMAINETNSLTKVYQILTKIYYDRIAFSLNSTKLKRYFNNPILMLIHYLVKRVFF